MMKGASKIGAVLLSGGMMVASLHAADEKSGVLVGAEVGYGFDLLQEYTTSTAANGATTGATTTSLSNRTTTFPYANVGLKVGYGYFFNKYIGLRGYVSYNYGINGSRITTPATTEGTTTTPESTTNTYNSTHQVAANIDVVWDFINIKSVSLGVYAGVGFGYASHSSSSSTSESATITNTITQYGAGFVLPINVGLELGVGNHHRISLNGKIPTLQAKRAVSAAADATEANVSEYRNRQVIVSVGYSYVF